MSNVVPIDPGAQFFGGCSGLQARWLSAYIKASGDPVLASQTARTDYMEVNVWLRDDEVFRAAYEDARTVIGRELEAAAMAKARSEEGTDRLMIELLRGFLPERYDPNHEPEKDDEEYNGSFTHVISVDPQEESYGA